MFSTTAMIKYFLQALPQVVNLVSKEIKRRRMQEEENNEIEMALVRKKKTRSGMTIEEIIRDNQK